MNEEHPSEAVPRPRPWVVGVAALLVSVAGTAVIIYALHSAFPFNPVALPSERNMNVKFWTPEGWKFFTRNPREPWLLTFRPTPAGRWEPLTLGPNALLGNLLGFDRAPRSQMIETAFIVNAIDERTWKACGVDPAECLGSLGGGARVVNPSPHPTLCGPVGVALVEQRPWAWARSNAPMPSRVVRVEVQCSRS